MNCAPYQIETKYDFLTGMYLIAKIEDADLDENALYTIRDDCPDFILPFNFKNVDGQTVFTYKVGDLCKLQYFYGEVSFEEYISLWRGLLSPLLDCKDWLMNPCCFVLDADYLYYDKSRNTIVYLYVPGLSGCSGNDAFTAMATEIVGNIKVTDPVLENKVLRSILGNFDPNDFLGMLQSHLRFLESAGAGDGAGGGAGGGDGTGAEESIASGGTGACESEAFASDESNDLGVLRIADALVPMGEVLSLPRFVDAPEADGTHCEANSFNKKSSDVKSKQSGGLKLFSGKGKRKGETRRNGFRNALPSAPPLSLVPKLIDAPPATEETRIAAFRTGLRLVGRASLPQAIAVEIADGEIFTIGRFDASIGKKRSSFEFGARTKAVSRRHAAIERHGTAYTIVDLSSSAGTYVNDKKIPVNTPVPLKSGCRVSLGNSGADYVWENN